MSEGDFETIMTINTVKIRPLAALNYSPAVSVCPSRPLPNQEPAHMPAHILTDTQTRRVHASLKAVLRLVDNELMRPIIVLHFIKCHAFIIEVLLVIFFFFYLCYARNIT